MAKFKHAGGGRCVQGYVFKVRSFERSDLGIFEQIKLWSKKEPKRYTIFNVLNSEPVKIREKNPRKFFYHGKKTSELVKVEILF